MICEKTSKKDYPACVRLDSMKEVRANLLFENGQHDRLLKLRREIEYLGGDLYMDCGSRKLFIR